MLSKLNTLLGVILEKSNRLRNGRHSDERCIFCLTDLPLDLFPCIARFLPPVSVYALACTSRASYRACYAFLPQVAAVEVKEDANVVVTPRNKKNYTWNEDVPLDDLPLVTWLKVKRASCADSCDIPPEIVQIVARLPCLKEIEHSPGRINVIALNTLCQIVGEHLEKLTLGLKLVVAQPPMPILPWKRLTALELTTSLLETDNYEPTLLVELANAFPVLRELTIHTWTSGSAADSILTQCTFPLLWYFEIRFYFALFLFDQEYPTLDPLVYFLERHSATLTSLVLPAGTGPYVHAQISDLRALDAALANSRICALHLCLALDPPTAWNDSAISSLGVLHLSGLNRVTKSGAVWPNAPNLHTLTASLDEMESLDLKMMAIAYPLLRELYLEVRDGYIQHYITKDLISLFSHLWWISIWLPKAQGQKRKVLRVQVLRGPQGQVVRVIKYKISDSACLVGTSAVPLSIILGSL